MLDLAETNLVQQSFAAALAEAGHFDVVINNAGGGHFGPAATIPTGVLAQQFQTLVLAQIELCRLALQAMEKRGGGLIINVSSLASRLPVPYMAAYNAAKAAMASFTMTLQLERRGSAVHVVDLQPGDIRTSFNDSVLKSETRDVAMAQAWEVVEKNMKAAPPPDLVARRILALIEQANPPPRVTVGDPFQTMVAPLIFKLIPQRVRLWGLKKYYRL